MAVSSDALFTSLLEDLSSYSHFGATSYQLLNEADTAINPWDTPSAAAAKSLARAFYKKFVDDATGDGEAKAWKKFTAMNHHCEHYRLSEKVNSSWDDELIGEFKNQLARMLFPRPDSTFEYYDILSEARNGPGASINVSGCDGYSKLFSSKGSTTNLFLSKYLEYFFSSNSRWRDALSFRREHYGDPEKVEGSKLSFVPKNRDIMRSICTEPSLNMFYQLGLGTLLERRLKAYSGIDLSTQPCKNRLLAERGSVDGSFATIDLASASDTISVSLLREVLPKNLFEVLMKLRCKQTTYKKESVALHMVSTMGNGFTFPLQTIIFTCAVLAVYRIHGKDTLHPFGDSLGNYGVFGDDIIVETSMFRPVCRLLGMLGFFVNEDKSFSEGPFRESCGVDFFMGVNIRGVYVKTLRSEQSLAVLVNRLNEFTSRTGIPVPKTIAHLLRYVRFQPVPMAENDDAGIKVPYCMLRKRKLDKHTQSIRYDRWVARPAYLTVDVDHEKIYVPQNGKKRVFNPDGLILSFLQGGLREYRISVRLDKTRYERRRGISPNWDFIPTALGMRNPKADGSRLIDAILANLLWLVTPET